MHLLLTAVYLQIITAYCITSSANEDWIFPVKFLSESNMHSPFWSCRYPMQANIVFPTHFLYTSSKEAGSRPASSSLIRFQMVLTISSISALLGSVCTRDAAEYNKVRNGISAQTVSAVNVAGHFSRRIQTGDYASVLA